MATENEKELKEEQTECVQNIYGQAPDLGALFRIPEPVQAEDEKSEAIDFITAMQNFFAIINPQQSAETEENAGEQPNFIYGIGPDPGAAFKPEAEAEADSETAGEAEAAEEAAEDKE